MHLATTSFSQSFANKLILSKYSYSMRRVLPHESTRVRRTADVVNMVHECEIYEGGSVLELGYVIPKLLKKLSKSLHDSGV